MECTYDRENLVICLKVSKFDTPMYYTFRPSKEFFLSNFSTAEYIFLDDEKEIFFRRTSEFEGYISGFGLETKCSVDDIKRPVNDCRNRIMVDSYNSKLRKNLVLGEYNWKMIMLSVYLESNYKNRCLYRTYQIELRTDEDRDFILRIGSTYKTLQFRDFFEL